MKNRRAITKARTRRLRQQDAAGAKRVGQVYVAGVGASVTYGADFTGLPAATARALRAERLRLDRNYLAGASVDAQYLLLPLRSDPAFKAELAPLRRYHTEFLVRLARGYSGMARWVSVYS